MSDARREPLALTATSRRQLWPGLSQDQSTQSAAGKGLARQQLIETAGRAQKNMAALISGPFLFHG